MRRLALTLMILVCSLQLGFTQEKPIRLGVVGLTHGHVGWILGRAQMQDMKMVAIVEPNKELAQRLAKEYGFSMEIVFDTMDEMVAAITVDAVAAFGSIYEHLDVVRRAAPKGLHIMVEKPLAVSLEHAQEMKALATKYNVHLLTNFETSWYPTNVKLKQELGAGAIGEVRKVIVRDGHKGPKKIGVQTEFLEWLTDPKLNGGGAITDFGCYGANLLTWLFEGKKPNSVTAVTQQLQANNNPKVDDDATIILKYDTSMAILEPSWNWPIGRKDMEVYGTLGALYADNRNTYRKRMAKGYDGFEEEVDELPERPYPFNDPFAVFSAVINGTLNLEPFDPYSLENNMIVMEILEAAIQSTKTGKTLHIED